MKSRFVFRLLALLAVPVQIALADAKSDEWIAKGRAALGTEQALDAVTSVRYTGTLETTEKVADKTDPTKQVDRPVRLAIDIVFQKPCQQRITLRSDKVVETTALDDYDAWLRRAEIGHEDKWQLTLLDPGQIRKLRANTWENLAFYRGLEDHGGQVEYKGEADVDGQHCAVVDFLHGDGISFTRYFDQATGRLVKTVTENGGEIREQGELIVNGVRYPKVLINKSPGGQITTITFDSIKVNEPLPEADFVVPQMAVDEGQAAAGK